MDNTTGGGARGSLEVTPIRSHPAATTHLLSERERTPVERWRAVWEAAFALVISRFSGQDDIVFGAARYDRRAPGGVRSVVRRVRCEDATTAAELVAELAQDPIDPIEPIEADADARATGNAPELVERFISVPPGPGRAIAVPTVRPCTDSARPVALHVTVMLAGAQTPRLVAVHDPRSLLSEACGRMLAALEHVAAEIVRDPERPLGHIHVLPPEDERRIVSDWNETARPFDQTLGIHTSFERQAARRPTAVAVEADGGALTYRQLDRRANQLARALIERGAGPGRYVGVCLERNANLVVALLGVVKSGAAYVPLDPGYPTERLTTMRAVAGADLVITEPHLRHLFDRAATIVEMDARGLRAREDVPVEPPAWRPEQAADPCYAIFTSGSTGVPKGVVMTHRAVVNTLDWVNRSFGVGPGDRALLVSSPSFDLSVYDVFGVLGAGGTLVVASGALLGDPEALARDLVDQRITIWNSAPAGLQRTLPFVSPPKSSPTARPRRESREGDQTYLRLVLLSGDWIPLQLPDDVRKVFPAAEVVALGGATEAAIWSNAFRPGAAGVDRTWRSIPYGRPIQNARYHILDRRMHPVPVGVQGDLYIGGTCLASGYLGRPDLTAERFVPDPFRAGERLYRTGDLARYFPDGTIEFLGRADSQVKILGHRIELAEVEAALLRQPGVQAAVCTAEADAGGHKRLAAFVVPAGRAELDPTALRRALARQLPKFMVPGQIVLCRSLPLTSNGKIDRQPAALRRQAERSGLSPAEARPKPGPERRPSRAAEVVASPLDADAPRDAAPHGPLEATLREVWEELLGVPRVGRHDNFYDLGGHSLLAVKMVVALRARLRLTVPLSALISHATIARLASFLTSALRSPEPGAPPTDDEAGDGARDGGGDGRRHGRTGAWENDDGGADVAAPADVADLAGLADLADLDRREITGELPGAGTRPRAKGARQRTPHLFTLNAAGTRPPLVLVAGLGGHAFTFGTFPGLLGDDQPIYAFNAIGTGTDEPPRPRTIEEIAEIYEEELDQIVPHGPIVLGGFSFGAAAALELARRLLRRGREIPLFISLDGFAPNYPRRLSLPARLWAHGRELLASGPAARRAYLARTRKNLRARLLRARGRQLELVPDLHPDEESNRRAKEHWLENKRALQRYRPTTAISSALLLVRVERPERRVATEMSDPLYGWADYVSGPATLMTVPGAHLALVKSPANQRAVADAIAKHMAAVVARLPETTSAFQTAL